MKSFFELIRYRNLLMIAATQYMMRYCIIQPFLKLNGLYLQLSEFLFFLLVLTTVLITASGYIINDYFDIRTDRINKPDKVVIERHISRRLAIFLHIIFTVAGILIGCFLSWYVGVLPLALIFFLCAGTLWFYSTTYKRQFLIGNLVISLMTGGVPLIVAFYEIPLLNNAYGDIMIRNNANFNYIFYWVAGFGFFAFYTNFIREIIKDAEDFEGDNMYGKNTLPVNFGIKRTRILLVFLTAILLIMLTMVMRYIVFSGEKPDTITAGYFIFLLIIPVSLLLFSIIQAKSKKDFGNASVLIKLIMLTGMLYACLVRYIAIYQIA